MNERKNERKNERLLTQREEIDEVHTKRTSEHVSVLFLLVFTLTLTHFLTDPFLRSSSPESNEQ